MYKAVTTHITGNLWLWTVIGLGISGLGMLASYGLGRGYYTAEIITLAAMFSATTMILVSQEGIVHPDPVEDDEA